MMVSSLLLLVALSGTPAMAIPDTTFAVDRGEDLAISNLFGEVHIRAWDRDVVSVRVDEGSATAVSVQRSGNQIRIGAEDGLRRARRASYSISVPSWMGVVIEARDLEIDVRGTRGELGIQTLEGDVRLTDVHGIISVSTLEGEIEVFGGDGTFALVTLDDDVTVSGLAGVVAIQASDGEITMTDMSAQSVTANTVDGSVEFEGQIFSGGEYRLSTHEGDVNVWTVGEVDAVVSVSTYRGEFESEFPIQLSWLDSGRGLEFRLGEGSATIMLAAFDGDITLHRAQRR